MQGESARRTVASAEVGREPDVQGAAVRLQDFNGGRWGTMKYADPMKMRNVIFPNLCGSFFDSIYTSNFIFS